MKLKNILIECNHPITAPGNIRMGWKHVFDFCGYNCQLWNQSKKNVFDAFYEYQPDLFIADSFSLTTDIIKCLHRYKEVKTAFYCSVNGELGDKIDTNIYPIVKVCESEKENIKTLRKIGKPDLMFLHLTDEYVEPVIGRWQKEFDIPVVGIPTGADTLTYDEGTVKPEYVCDLAFIGGYWQYKALTLDKYLEPISRYPFKYNTKIFGYNKWNYLNYLGCVRPEEQKNIFKSAVICPNIHEKHSNDFGFDVVERIFKIPISGGFVISDYVEELNQMFNDDEIPKFSNYNQFIELIDHFLKYPEERLPYISRMKTKIMSGHTYFHRMSKLLNALGNHEEADWIVCNNV